MSLVYLWICHRILCRNKNLVTVPYTFRRVILLGCLDPFSFFSVVASGLVCFVLFVLVCLF